MKADACWLCTADQQPEPKLGDDLPLCPTHWDAWVNRYALSDDTPPCSAHRIAREGTTP